MENKFNESTPQRPEGDRILDGKQVFIDLPGFLEQIKDEKAWKKSDRNAITVFKTEGLTHVLVALRKGAEMARTSTDGILTVYMLQGHIQFVSDALRKDVEEGEMIVLHENQPYSITAKKKSSFLLIVSGSKGDN